MAEHFWVETLGCPKNQVDSDKLVGTLAAEGLRPAASPAEADLVVVNTCAFIEAARQESIDTILQLSDLRRSGARLVVTGCLAERHGDEVAAALPEVDLVAGFGVPVTLRPTARSGGRAPVVFRRHLQAAPGVNAGAPDPAAAGSTGHLPPAVDGSGFDLLNLPRPAAGAPWAYVKVAEGCDRRCGFCAIPSFRGVQRSRSADAVLDEVAALGPQVQEVVLVAQDLASWGGDRADPGVVRRRGAHRPLVTLMERLTARVPRVRLLYLYPSSLDGALIDAIAGSGVPYFDLSLQHVSRPLVQRMRRFGDGERFLERIATIRAAAPEAALRSSFIVGYPGESEDDHDLLLQFLQEAQLDWAGFFTFSAETGTYAAGLSGQVPADLAMQRLREAAELQDAITARRRADLVGRTVELLVDAPGVGRSYREAPEIDGVVHVPASLSPGAFYQVQVTAVAGPDLWGEPAAAASRPAGSAGVAAVRSGAVS